MIFFFSKIRNKLHKVGVIIKYDLDFNSAPYCPVRHRRKALQTYRINFPRFDWLISDSKFDSLVTRFDFCKALFSWFYFHYKMS